MPARAMDLTTGVVVMRQHRVVDKPVESLPRSSVSRAGAGAVAPVPLDAARARAETATAEEHGLTAAIA